MAWHSQLTITIWIIITQAQEVAEETQSQISDQYIRTIRLVLTTATRTCSQPSINHCLCNTIKTITFSPELLPSQTQTTRLTHDPLVEHTVREETLVLLRLPLCVMFHLVHAHRTRMWVTTPVQKTLINQAERHLAGVDSMFSELITIRELFSHQLSWY